MKMGLSGEPHDVKFGNGKFVAIANAVSDSGVYPPKALVSDDGRTWTTSKDLPQQLVAQRIAFGAGMFVTAGMQSHLRSTDGMTWTAFGPEPASYLSGTVDFAGGRFLSWTKWEKDVAVYDGNTWSSGAVSATNYMLDDLRVVNDRFVGVIFRPATVCVYAPRLRLDLSVNILTNHAVTNNKITVFGGSQLRPNLHVQDYADLCKLLLVAPTEKIANQIFNCGYQNMSIMEIAHMVKKVVEQEFPQKAPIDIVTTPTDDNRSYHINSDKIKKTLGFAPKHTIEEAVRDLCRAFRDGKIPNSFSDDRFYNVRTLKKLKAA